MLFHVQNQLPCALCDPKFDHLGIIVICFVIESWIRVDRYHFHVYAVNMNLPRSTPTEALSAHKNTVLETPLQWSRL